MSLGAYAEGFAVWRRILGDMAEEDRFGGLASAGHEVARFIVSGLDQVEATDALAELAAYYGLDEEDPDQVQAILARTVDEADELRVKATDEAEPHPNGNGHDPEPGEPPGQKKALNLMALLPDKEDEITPRNWVVPGLLMSCQVTVLVAPSGSGKSLLTLQLGMACAQGIAWAGWKPRRICKVLIINSEDDVDEMRRRIAAALRVMAEIKRDEIRDRFIAVEQGADAIIAKFNARTKTLVRTPLLEQIIDIIITNKFDIVFVDPFAETFEGDENSNSELKWAGMLWREVARRTGAAICLVHHTKKYASGMAGDVDAARGASALIGIARIVATLFPMTDKEADQFLVDETEKNRVAYLRFDDAKANLNLISTIAKWFRKRTITLNNGTETLPPDDVGVLVPWRPKGPLDGFDNFKIGEFFNKLDRGMVDKDDKPTGEFWTLQSRKNKESDMSRYVGDFVGEFFEVDDARSSAMVAAWRKAKAFFEDKYMSPRTRREVTRVRSRNAQGTNEAQGTGDMEPEPV